MHQITVPTAPTNKRKLAYWIVAIVGVLILLAVAFLILKWPFRPKAVRQELEKTSLSRVTFAGWHGTYFPRPGCVLEKVVFQHNPKPGSPPLITVERIRIEGSYTGLLTSHVKLIRAEGLHVLIPPRKTEQFQANPRSKVVIDYLIADGAILEVARRNGQPLKFLFHAFTLNHVGANGPATFHAKFSNPEPPGEIVTTGKFGPWNERNIGKTAVSGEYSFEHADLGIFQGIAGSLFSTGKFQGEVSHVEVQGETNIPNFTVTSSSHKVQLQTHFQAEVNGENGNTALHNAIATFWQTTVSSNGSLEGKTGQPGKTVSLELAAKDGRIQDILRLFAKAEHSPMSGITNMRAKVLIPPGQRPFLKKVDLVGDFGIDAGAFSNPATQQGVNHLSEGARGEHYDEKADPATVLSDLRGHVVLKDGAARFSNLSFTVPGASAHMQGTYDLITEKIDLHGTLKTASSPGNTAGGAKALILKVLGPFFKKKAAGYEMPVKITGTYDHPSFGLDLGNSKDRKHEQKTWEKLGLSTPNSK